MKLEPAVLTAKQEKAWSETLVALVWNCPAFSHLLYSMMDTAKSKHIALFSKEIPIAATDGSALILNPDTFFTFNLHERVFIVTHEILHCVMNHCILGHAMKTRGKISYADGTSLPYDHTTYNKATDYVINDVLVESKIGAMPMKDGKQIGLWDRNMATATDAALDAYKKLYKKNPPPKGPKGPGDSDGPGGGSGHGGFDEHLQPGTSQGKAPSQASQERDESTWKTAVAAALNAAKVQGKLPAGLERLLGELLEPQVDWKDHIASLFARKVGSGSYDWRKPDRRLIVRDMYAPGRSGFGAGCVVVGIDTSGSIGQLELDMFFAEMSGILEDVRPKRLLVMWCDAHVHRVDEVEEASDLTALRAGKAPGGGGTSFVPVFEEIEKMGLEPDALVYLTDGMGDFPGKAPSYPVIWGNIYPASKYPFGDVVDVPKQAA
jgi:predicted metal-dependent peptidase